VIKIMDADRQGKRMGRMAASDAERLLKTYTYYTDDPDSPNGKGYQRPPDESRYAEIAADIEMHGVTPIILSDRGRWKSILGDGSIDVAMTLEEMLEVLDAAGEEGREVFLSVIDGQHRTQGALRLLARGIDVDIPFELLVDLTWPEEVERFNTINTKAKNLPKALVEVNRMNVFDSSKATNRERQEQDVREVVFALERDEDSPWHHQVNMTGGRNTGRPVTFEGLRRSSLSTFTGPLALLPLATKVEMAKSFWRVVAETWPNAWNDVPEVVERVNATTNEWETVEVPVKYRIKDLAGVSALAKIAGHVLQEAWDPATQQLRMGLVRARLGRGQDISWVKAKDNPDMNAQAGFSGLADMYDMLLRRLYGEGQDM
jgi:DGQHR domain-containing protein